MTSHTFLPVILKLFRMKVNLSLHTMYINYIIYLTLNRLIKQIIDFDISTPEVIQTHL